MVPTYEADSAGVARLTRAEGTGWCPPNHECVCTGSVAMGQAEDSELHSEVSSLQVGGDIAEAEFDQSGLRLETSPHIPASEPVVLIL